MQHVNQTYKYQLDRSSRKYQCPRCGKRTFVLYLDESGSPLSPNVGKCDRKDKCSWHYTPSDYFRDCQGRGGGVSVNTLPAPPPPPPPVCAPSFISSDMVKRTIQRYEDNSLSMFLHSVFDGMAGAEVVSRAIISGAVGTAKTFGGSPVFWQIDQRGSVRTGKIMGYNPHTGKRIKDPKPQMQWVHSIVKRNNPEYVLQQCFYGSHKAMGEDSIIWLFESEKTALIVSIILMWGKADDIFVTMACGGCEGLNPTDEAFRDPWNKHGILKGRRVVLFPDNGKYREWGEKARELAKHCREVYVSDVMEGDRLRELGVLVKDGDDLGDVIIKYVETGRNPADLLMMSY